MGPADDYITEGSALSQKVPPLRDWQAIVDRHGRLVWQTAYRLLGNRADAADCFQEAFVSALAVSRREEVRDWSALLQRLATARALDRLRQRLRRGRRSDEVADWGAMLSPNPSPEESVEAAELRGKLRWAVAQLPSRQAEVFCLRCLGDMSYRQIAVELGIKRNAVGVLLHRARSRLRELLASAADQEP